MAKLKGPLFSLHASGALAKTLVYFGWKGLKVVRSYVIPANPNTTDQQTQRGYLTTAVALIHAAIIAAANALDEDDQNAYRRLAGTHPTPRTWFNEAVKQCVDAEVAGFGQVIYANGTITDPTVAAFDMIMTLEEAAGITLAAATFFFGSTPSNLIHQHAATVTPNTSVAIVAGDLSAFLTAGLRYYVQCRPNTADPAQGCNSGIYSFVAI